MENSVTNPIAGMDMDESDEKKLYEMAEDADARGFKNPKQNSYVINNTTPSTSCWTKVTPIAIFTLILLVVLVVILQAITIHQVITNPESSDNDNVGATDALRTDTPGCNCSSNDVSIAANAALMKRLDLFLNKTSEILDAYEEQTTYIQNGTDGLEDISQTTEESALRIKDMIGTLSYLKENSITTEVLVNDVLAIVEEVLKVQNISLNTKELDPTSCQDIRDARPDSPSGYYHIHSQIVYCEMGELCGSEGGWTRLAYLDMSDGTSNCPDGFRLYQTNGVRACGRPWGGPSCSSATFESYGVTYTEVCGKVVGYQYASTDAVDTRFASEEIRNDINSYYADGALITQGYPRQHLWSYIAGVSDSKYDNGNCPCNDPPGGTQEIRPFMGDHYYCESGNPSGWTFKLYTDDPLWDGDGCGTQEGNCCSVPNQPWFNRTVNASTDHLELRVCSDEHTYWDDCPVSFYSLYVK